MPETSSHQRYRGRVEYLSQDLQLLDASIKLTVAKVREATPGMRVPQALGVDPLRYSRLNHPLGHILRLVNHARANNARGACIATFRNVTEYLRSVLTEMYSQRPLQIVGLGGANRQISFVDLVSLGSFEAIKERMIDEAFRSLENKKDTPALLDAVLRVADVTVPDDVKIRALAYMEMRHLFIHNGGMADDRFTNTYGSIVRLGPDGKLPTNFRSTTRGVESVSGLVGALDSGLIAAGLVTPRAGS